MFPSATFPDRWWSTELSSGRFAKLPHSKLGVLLARTISVRRRYAARLSFVKPIVNTNDDDDDELSVAPPFLVVRYTYTMHFDLRSSIYDLRSSTIQIVINGINLGIYVVTLGM